MLATAIISSAFTVGDSVTYSLKYTAADGSGAIEAAFFQNGVETVNVKELIS